MFPGWDKVTPPVRCYMKLCDCRRAAPPVRRVCIGLFHARKMFRHIKAQSVKSSKLVVKSIWNPANVLVFQGFFGIIKIFNWQYLYDFCRFTIKMFKDERLCSIINSHFYDSHFLDVQAGVRTKIHTQFTLPIHILHENEEVSAWKKGRRKSGALHDSLLNFQPIWTSRSISPADPWVPCRVLLRRVPFRVRCRGSRRGCSSLQPLRGRIYLRSRRIHSQLSKRGCPWW